MRKNNIVNCKLSVLIRIEFLQNMLIASTTKKLWIYLSISDIPFIIIVIIMKTSNSSILWVALSLDSLGKLDGIAVMTSS
jgi:hypothetical protein